MWLAISRPIRFKKLDTWIPHQHRARQIGERLPLQHLCAPRGAFCLNMLSSRLPARWSFGIEVIMGWIIAGMHRPREGAEYNLANHPILKCPYLDYLRTYAPPHTHPNMPHLYLQLDVYSVFRVY